MISKTCKLLMLGVTACLFSNFANAMMPHGNYNHHGHPNYQPRGYYQGPSHQWRRGYPGFHRSRVIIIRPGFYGPGIVVKRW